MTWVSDVMAVFQKIATVEGRLTHLMERYDALALAYENLRERVARLEGKFELLERLGASRRKRLPPSG